MRYELIADPREIIEEWLYAALPMESKQQYRPIKDFTEEDIREDFNNNRQEDVTDAGAAGTELGSILEDINPTDPNDDVDFVKV